MLSAGPGHFAHRAGLDVSAIGIAFAIASPLSGRLASRVGPLPPMLAGLVLSGLATLGLLRLRHDTGIGATWWISRPARGPSGRRAPGCLECELFVDGLHDALWVSGLAPLAAAVLVALLFFRDARGRR